MAHADLRQAAAGTWAPAAVSPGAATVTLFAGCAAEAASARPRIRATEAASGTARSVGSGRAIFQGRACGHSARYATRSPALSVSEMSPVPSDQARKSAVSILLNGICNVIG